MNKINLIRGDTHNFRFQRLDNDGNPILQKAERLYFSVKRRINDVDTLFQKTIDDMEFDAEGFYHFTIEPQNTDNLEPRIYVYDIEVVDGTYKQTISIGEISLVEDVTTPANEVE